jgi:hypothetical protein
MHWIFVSEIRKVWISLSVIIFCRISTIRNQVHKQTSRCVKYAPNRSHTLKNWSIGIKIDWLLFTISFLSSNSWVSSRSAPMSWMVYRWTTLATRKTATPGPDQLSNMLSKTTVYWVDYIFTKSYSDKTKMSMIDLLLDAQVFQVSSLALRQVCTQFARSPLSAQYRVLSSVSSEVLVQFLSALEGKSICNEGKLQGTLRTVQRIWLWTVKSFISNFTGWSNNWRIEWQVHTVLHRLQASCRRSVNTAVCCNRNADTLRRGFCSERTTC